MSFLQNGIWYILYLKYVFGARTGLFQSLLPRGFRTVFGESFDRGFLNPLWCSWDVLWASMQAEQFFGLVQSFSSVCSSVGYHIILSIERRGGGPYWVGSCRFRTERLNRASRRSFLNCLWPSWRVTWRSVG